MNSGAMLISFVLPAYKSEFLYDAIDSIMTQNNQDLELIVVDDCSPDDIETVVNSFRDDRIHYYRNERNIGRDNLVGQWNHSISLAKGEWIVLAADDDLYDARFVEECLRLIKKYPEVDVVRSRVMQIDTEGNNLWDDGMLSEFTDKYEYLHDWLTAKAFTCVGNFMFRRSALERLGGFIEFPCAFNSDVATPIALSRKGVANTTDMLFRFRRSAVHLSADTSRHWEKLTATTQLFRWLMALEYEEPDNDRDRMFYSIHNPKYLHDKCVYDYFNQVIKFTPLEMLPKYLKNCELATRYDKLMIILRWFRYRFKAANRFFVRK